jgi:hypothetical protein
MQFLPVVASAEALLVAPNYEPVPVDTTVHVRGTTRLGLCAVRYAYAHEAYYTLPYAYA